MAVGTEVINCNQCGSPNSSVVARGTDREYFTTLDEFTIVKCTGCGLVYLNPRPVAAELGTIYPPNYHSYILDSAAGSKDSFITRMRQKAGANRFKPVMKHLMSFDHIDLLDIGCGNGWMMQQFKTLDPQRISTYGVEISETACQEARKLGHTAYCGRFEDVEIGRTFDLVNLTHVIEHVSDPRLVVRKAYALLKPGGILAMETPNIGSYEWPWFRDGNWGAYHIPRHWYLYDRDTIRALGQSEGFEMIDWSSHPGPTHWVWTLNNICRASGNPLAKYVGKLFNPVRVFRGGLVPAATLAAFFVLDTAMIAFGRPTSVMMAIFKK